MESPPQWLQPLFAVICAFQIALISHTSRSHTTSGAVAAFIVMTFHILVGFRFSFMLFAFFLSLSWITMRTEDKKRKLGLEYKKGRQRNWVHVLANSGIGSVLVATIWILPEGLDKCVNFKDSNLITSLIGGVVGHYSCCAGNIWSSELGIVTQERTFLITRFITRKRVRKGTNGGVTTKGLKAAAKAGTLIGASFFLQELLTKRCEFVLKKVLVIPIAFMAGLGGSIIKSLLGATLQFSGYCAVLKKVVERPAPTVKRISGHNLLDNNAVNLLSVLLTTILTSIICVYIY
ncbi:protein PGR-like [Gastrolobium bilobum]|uniref:protein PGR-like n=1 Tax=Gastrolobium bilobum TaxID=150636 RepID=UPI002AB01A85|nr:protein PGR-like [Gastrolobium bilobum]